MPYLTSHSFFFFSEKKSFNFGLQFNDITDFLAHLRFLSQQDFLKKKIKITRKLFRQDVMLCKNFIARFAIGLSLFRDQVANDDYTL